MQKGGLSKNVTHGATTVDSNESMGSLRNLVRALSTIFLADLEEAYKLPSASRHQNFGQQQLPGRRYFGILTSKLKQPFLLLEHWAPTVYKERIYSLPLFTFGIWPNHWSGKMARQVCVTTESWLVLRHILWLFISWWQGMINASDKTPSVSINWTSTFHTHTSA